MGPRPITQTAGGKILPFPTTSKYNNCNKLLTVCTHCVGFTKEECLTYVIYYLRQLNRILVENNVSFSVMRYICTLYSI